MNTALTDKVEYSFLSLKILPYRRTDSKHRTQRVIGYTNTTRQHKTHHDSNTGSNQTSVHSTFLSGFLILHRYKCFGFLLVHDVMAHSICPGLIVFVTPFIMIALWFVNGSITEYQCDYVFRVCQDINKWNSISPTISEIKVVLSVGKALNCIATQNIYDINPYQSAGIAKELQYPSSTFSLKLGDFEFCWLLWLYINIGL